MNTDEDSKNNFPFLPEITTFTPNPDGTIDCVCGGKWHPGTVDLVACKCGRVFLIREPVETFARAVPFVPYEYQRNMIERLLAKQKQKP